MQTFETRLTLTKDQEDLIFGLCIAHSEGVRHSLSATYRQGKNAKIVYAELTGLGLTAKQASSAQNVSEMIFKRQLEADKYLKNQLEKRIVFAKKSLSNFEMRLDKKKLSLFSMTGSAKKKAAIQIKLDEQNLILKKQSLSLSEKRLDILTKRLASNKVKICFGGKKLLKQNPKTNKDSIYETYADWRHEWDLRRNNSVTSIGEKTKPNGNPEIQWNPGNNVLRIRLTNAQAKVRMQDLAKNTGLDVEYGTTDKIRSLRMQARFIEIQNVDFVGHNGEARKKIIAAQGKLPLAAKIVIREGGKFYLHISVARQDSPAFIPRERGALGVDFNVKGVAWAVVKPDGNLDSKNHGFIEWNIQKQKSGTVDVEMGTVAKKLANIAKLNNVAMAIENLDFEDKKANLAKRKEYNAMISTLATKKFVNMMEKQCLDSQIGLYLVNPRYSSVGGFAKYGRFLRGRKDESSAQWIGRQAIFGDTYRKRDMPCVKHGVKLHKEVCRIRGLQKRKKQSMIPSEKASWSSIASGLNSDRKLWHKKLKALYQGQISTPSPNLLAQNEILLDQKTCVNAVHEKLHGGESHLFNNLVERLASRYRASRGHGEESC